MHSAEPYRRARRGSAKLTGVPDPHGHAGQAYLVRPESGVGPGVLLLHSWWGLNRATKDTADALAGEGFVVVAPDLFDGRRPRDADEAEAVLAAADPNAMAALVLSSTVALRSQSADPDSPVSAVGFSMGGSWALWLATRQPDSVNAVVTYYGSQTIDFEALRAPVLGHFAESDALVTDDELTELHAHLLLLEKDVRIHRYAGTVHGFAEEGWPGAHDPPAAALAWTRTVEFLRRAAGMS